MIGLKRMLVRLTRLVSLKKGGDVTDYAGTIKAMKKTLPLKGANLWILLCSTILTCVGLDLNSATLLIGAMLISPLMNLVLAVGIFQAIRDWENLALAVRNLVIATVACMAFSMIYFSIDPYGEFTPAMMARSKPTLIDALIAGVGGMAGIISLTRKEQLAAFPGVAISITLMPPICTMSYALANARWTLTGGSFYLFLINAIIIAAASTIVVRMLGFPLMRNITKKQRLVRVHLSLIGIGIFLLPSYFFLVDSISEKEDYDMIEAYVTETFPPDSLTSTQWELLSTDSGQVVKIVYQGSVLSADSIQSLTAKFDSMHIPNTSMRIVQPIINKEVVDHIAKTIDDLEEVKKRPIKDTLTQNIVQQLKSNIRDVKELELKKVSEKKLVAELHWRRVRFLVPSRKKKLEEIRIFLHDKLGKQVTVIEV